MHAFVIRLYCYVTDETHKLMASWIAVSRDHLSYGDDKGRPQRTAVGVRKNHGLSDRIRVSILYVIIYAGLENGKLKATYMYATDHEVGSSVFQVLQLNGHTVLEDCFGRKE